VQNNFGDKIANLQRQDNLSTVVTKDFQSYRRTSKIVTDIRKNQAFLSEDIAISNENHILSLKQK